MPRIVPFVNKPGQCGLLQIAAAGIGIIFCHLKGRDQRLRYDEKSQPEGRIEHFGKCSRINHPLMPVQPLQCLKRTIGITELTVIIILQDPDMVFCRPGEQRRSPRQTECTAARKLM